MEAYSTKELVFKFRGKDYVFALSHGLFSSADIDRGSRLLLKVLSQIWDKDMREGRPLPQRILDAGSGVGVIGICAAGALPLDGTSAGPSFPRVRFQDRDELARCFTLYNALRNHIPEAALDARAEPLLSGLPEERWDLILSNIPAKAGLPVLEDFVPRAASLLSPGGRVLLVVVNPLAEAFRSWIEGSRCPLLLETAGSQHRVFAYGPPARETAPDPILAGKDLMDGYPAYRRTRENYTLEGISYTLDAVQGAAGFDTPPVEVETAIKLACRLKLRDGLLSPERLAGAGILVHEPNQGHFPVWLARCLGEAPGFWVFSSRNVLALEASRHNFAKNHLSPPPQTVPAADLSLGTESLAEGAFAFIAAFPEIVPGTDRTAASWAGIRRLLRPGGSLIMALPSLQAGAFDRAKPEGFVRLGEIKRRGCRAMAYRLSDLTPSKTVGVEA